MELTVIFEAFQFANPYCDLLQLLEEWHFTVLQSTVFSMFDLSTTLSLGSAVHHLLLSKGGMCACLLNKQHTGLLAKRVVSHLTILRCTGFAIALLFNPVGFVL